MTRPAARRGLTLLEVVLASTLLALMASGLFGLLALITRAGLRERQRLASVEIANRIILMYLDDKASVDPMRGDTIAYGPHTYHWRLDEDKIALKESIRRDRAGGTAAIADPHRYKQVRVRVWLSEESGGAADPALNPPQALLSRIYDPLNIGRNPDSLRYLMQNPAAMEAWLRDMMGGAAAPAPPPAGRPGPGPRNRNTEGGR